jgi:DNA-binding FrmR family transcriptional regulator
MDETPTRPSIEFDDATLAGLQLRLRRIEGQVRGIHRMIDEDTYCIDILTQISALTSALQNVALGLVDDHLKHCVVDAAKTGGPEAEDKIAEASKAIARLVKS